MNLQIRQRVGWIMARFKHLKFLRISTLMLLLSISCAHTPVNPATATAGFAQVPFDFYHDAIIVQVRLNGQGPFNMMLDTGVDPSAIDLRTAKETGLKLAAAGGAVSGGGAGTNLAYETELPILEMGGLSAHHVRALALDLSSMSAALGRPLQGVLGYSLFKHRIVRFDFPKQVVRFYASPAALREMGQGKRMKTTKLRFRYRDEILVPDVLVNGEKMTANIDTGYNGSFKITPAAAGELGLDVETIQTDGKLSVGFNGATENRRTHLKSIVLGDISVSDPQAFCFRRGAGYDQEAWGIRVGNGFLKNFVVTLDYQNSTLWLQRTLPEKLP